MAIATGDWDERSGPQDRICIGLEARPTASEIQFTVLEPEHHHGQTRLYSGKCCRERAPRLTGP